ncbi:DNA polymerase theta, partial [Nematolebias whitei]|uniref:DNA polymerase theta n=1 Tax=Nematolebias whitei TaxID=451745 RepID=UPI00189B44D7
MQAKLSALESEAYSLAGHTFSLTSVDDVVQVLFLELHLPPHGDAGGPRSKKTLGYTRRGGGRARLGKHFSTTKRVKRHHPTLKMDRIYPVAQTHTTTGRVSFTEPNIQNVPKDFEVYMPTVISESPPSQNVFQVTRKS